MTKVLITGGAGFIGSHLVEALLERGFDVRVLDNFSTGDRNNLVGVAREIEIIDGDLRSLERVSTAVRGCEVVFHQGALPSVPRSVQDPLTSNDVNVTGTLNVLLAARDHDTRRVVYASSSSLYGSSTVEVKHEGLPVAPLSPYGVAKHAGEAYLKAFNQVYGLETVALRYFNVFGPRQNPVSEYAAVVPNFFAAAMLGEEAVVYGDGEQSRDFTYIANVVQANLRAAEAEGVAGEAFNVARGETHSVNSLVRKVGEIAGVDIPVRYAPGRAGDVPHSLADISKARERLGYDPAVDLEEGLRHTYEFFRSDESLLPRIHERRRWVALTA